MRGSKRGAYSNYPSNRAPLTRAHFASSIGVPALTEATESTPSIRASLPHSSPSQACSTARPRSWVRRRSRSIRELVALDADLAMERSEVAAIARSHTDFSTPAGGIGGGPSHQRVAKWAS